MKTVFSTLILFSMVTLASGPPSGPSVQDTFHPVDPSAVKLSGMLGHRCDINAANRLLTKNEDDLLSGFRKRPGKQAWVGEHVGKWLHAATLAWVYTRDAKLKDKLDRVASQLMDSQLPDGYLGTYTEDKRWSKERNYDWDVWVHKYDIIGLLTYAQYTGNQRAIEVSKKAADLLIQTFGPRGRLDINDRSTHVGMASGSILEPIMMLYHVTHAPRYLRFAEFLVDRWEVPNGPRLISTLTTVGSVKKTANAKAYEMLSCLVGLCELYRVTGEPKYMKTVQTAWNDIVENQLMITGSGSSKERWTENHVLPNDEKSDIAETCVTVTWIQLNQQLLRLTGESKYADELEKTVYNHLAAAQRFSGDAWAYYTPLEGTKPFRSVQNCCTSSGPRGWAMLPTFVYMTTKDGAVVNFFTPSSATLRVGDRTVVLTQETNYPESGAVSLRVKNSKPGLFTIYLRVPAWSQLKGIKGTGRGGQYYAVRKHWNAEETLRFELELPARLVKGIANNDGNVAIVRGPTVLALDEKYNSELGSLDSVAVENRKGNVSLTPVTNLRDTDSEPVYEMTVVRRDDPNEMGEPVKVRLCSFATASSEGTKFKVWLPGYNNFVKK